MGRDGLYRDLIERAYFTGSTQSELATQFNLPLGTVKSRLHRATRRLATRLAHLRPEENS